MRYKLKVMALPIVLITSLCLGGCATTHAANQIKNDTYYPADFLKDKGAYVGDNSAVGNILGLLPAHEYISGFYLQTVEMPYGITVHYMANDTNANAFSNPQKTDKFMGKNAAMLFYLIQNVDVIQFQLQGAVSKTYTFHRKDSQKAYGDLGKVLDSQASLSNFLRVE